MKKLDLSFHNKQKAVEGCVLLSDPFTQDPYFSRSAILLCRHNKKETFGFVLTNYIEIDLHKLDENMPEIITKISFGGPVEKDNLFYIHTFGKEIEGAEKIMDTLYFGGDYEMLFELIKAEPKRINEVRFFIGYAGWDFEQLNNEMKDHSWIAVTNISEKEILSTSSDHFWKDCMTKQGSKFEMISNFPLNPNEN
jgi:putative transcriptional regulator